MKKLVSLILILALLFSLAACGKESAPEAPEEPEVLPEAEPIPAPEPIPEPEPEPVDPRTLWAEAAAAAEAYSSVELERREEVSLSGEGMDYAGSNTTVIRGKNLDNRMMQYESVTTGDNPCEMYYINGVLHEEQEEWQYSCSMGIEEFSSYRTEEELPFVPEDFGAVELTGEENGWEITFSDPLESFEEKLSRLVCLSSLQLKEGSLEVTGTVLLDEDGFYRSVNVDLDFDLIYYGTMVVECSMTQFDRWLTHDGEVTVVIPTKVKNYTDVTDIRVIKKLETLAQFQDLTAAADYTSALSFEGTVNGQPLALTYDVHSVFLRDFLLQKIQLWENVELWVEYNGQEQSVTQQTEFKDGRTVVTVDGAATEVETEQEVFLAAAQQDFTMFTRESTPGELFWYPFGISRDGVFTIYVETTGYEELMLYSTVLAAGGFVTESGTFELADYEFIRGDGQLEIDEETQGIRSLTFDMEASFTMTDGTVISGTLRYERNFLAYNDDVVLEPGTGIGQTA